MKLSETGKQRIEVYINAQTDIIGDELNQIKAKLFKIIEELEAPSGTASPEQIMHLVVKHLLNESKKESDSLIYVNQSKINDLNRASRIYFNLAGNEPAGEYSLKELDVLLDEGLTKLKGFMFHLKKLCALRKLPDQEIIDNWEERILLLNSTNEDIASLYIAKSLIASEKEVTNSAVDLLKVAMNKCAIYDEGEEGKKNLERFVALLSEFGIKDIFSFEVLVQDLCTPKPNSKKEEMEANAIKVLSLFEIPVFKETLFADSKKCGSILRYLLSNNAFIEFRNKTVLDYVLEIEQVKMNPALYDTLIKHIPICIYAHLKSGKLTEREAAEFSDKFYQSSYVDTEFLKSNYGKFDETRGSISEVAKRICNTAIIRGLIKNNSPEKLAEILNELGEETVKKINKETGQEEHISILSSEEILCNSDLVMALNAEHLKEIINDIGIEKAVSFIKDHSENSKVKLISILFEGSKADSDSFWKDIKKGASIDDEFTVKSLILTEWFGDEKLNLSGHALIDIYNKTKNIEILNVIKNSPTLILKVAETLTANDKELFFELLKSGCLTYIYTQNPELIKRGNLDSLSEEEIKIVLSISSGEVKSGILNTYKDFIASNKPEEFLITAGFLIQIISQENLDDKFFNSIDKEVLFKLIDICNGTADSETGIKADREIASKFLDKVFDYAYGKLDKELILGIQNRLDPYWTALYANGFVNEMPGKEASLDEYTLFAVYMHRILLNPEAVAQLKEGAFEKALEQYLTISKILKRHEYAEMEKIGKVQKVKAIGEYRSEELKKSILLRLRENAQDLHEDNAIRQKVESRVNKLIIREMREGIKSDFMRNLRSWLVGDAGDIAREQLPWYQKLADKILPADNSVTADLKLPIEFINAGDDIFDKKMNKIGVMTLTPGGESCINFDNNVYMPLGTAFYDKAGNFVGTLDADGKIKSEILFDSKTAQNLLLHGTSIITDEVRQKELLQKIIDNKDLGNFLKRLHDYNESTQDNEIKKELADIKALIVNYIKGKEATLSQDDFNGIVMYLSDKLYPQFFEKINKSEWLTDLVDSCVENHEKPWALGAINKILGYVNIDKVSFELFSEVNAKIRNKDQLLFARAIAENSIITQDPNKNGIIAANIARIIQDPNCVAQLDIKLFRQLLEIYAKIFTKSKRVEYKNEKDKTRLEKLKEFKIEVVTKGLILHLKEALEKTPNVAAIEILEKYIEEEAKRSDNIIADAIRDFFGINNLGDRKIEELPWYLSLVNAIFAQDKNIVKKDLEIPVGTVNLGDTIFDKDGKELGILTVDGDIHIGIIYDGNQELGRVRQDDALKYGADLIINDQNIEGKTSYNIVQAGAKIGTPLYAKDKEGNLLFLGTLDFHGKISVEILLDMDSAKSLLLNQDVIKEMENSRIDQLFNRIFDLKGLKEFIGEIWNNLENYKPTAVNFLRYIKEQYPALDADEWSVIVAKIGNQDLKGIFNTYIEKSKAGARGLLLALLQKPGDMLQDDIIEMIKRSAGDDDGFRWAEKCLKNKGIGEELKNLIRAVLLSNKTYVAQLLGKELRELPEKIDDIELELVTNFRRKSYHEDFKAAVSGLKILKLSDNMIKNLDKDVRKEILNTQPIKDKKQYDLLTHDFNEKEKISVMKIYIKLLKRDEEKINSKIAAVAAVIDELKKNPIANDNWIYYKEALETLLSPGVINVIASIIFQKTTSALVDENLAENKKNIKDNFHLIMNAIGKIGRKEPKDKFLSDLFKKLGRIPTHPERVSKKGKKAAKNLAKLCDHDQYAEALTRKQKAVVKEVKVELKEFGLVKFVKRILGIENKYVSKNVETQAEESARKKQKNDLKGAQVEDKEQTNSVLIGLNVKNVGTIKDDALRGFIESYMELINTSLNDLSSLYEVETILESEREKHKEDMSAYVQLSRKQQAIVKLEKWTEVMKGQGNTNEDIKKTVARVMQSKQWNPLASITLHRLIRIAAALMKSNRQDASYLKKVFGPDSKFITLKDDHRKLRQCVIAILLEKLSCFVERGHTDLVFNFITENFSDNAVLKKTFPSVPNDILEGELLKKDPVVRDGLNNFVDLDKNGKGLPVLKKGETPLDFIYGYVEKYGNDDQKREVAGLKDKIEAKQADLIEEVANKDREVNNKGDDKTLKDLKAFEKVSQPPNDIPKMGNGN